MSDESLTHSPAISPLLYPLDDVYTYLGRKLPTIESLDGDLMPDPYKLLLVHENDMTPTLQNFHRDSIHVHALHAEERDGEYFREVLLKLNGSKRPVEYGAIKINLNLLPNKTRQEIIEARLPFGQILFAHEIPHSSRPKAYLQIQSDEHIAGALRIDGNTKLYGRRNTLNDEQNRPLAEIVEILPPEKNVGD